MKRLTTTTQILIVVTLVAILLCVGAFFLFSMIKTNNQETSKLASELAFYEEKKQEINQSKQAGERPEAFEQEINSYFVGKDGVVQFIETLEAEAKNHNVVLTIRDVSVQQYDKEKAEDTKEYMVLKLETKSSWQNFMYFLAYIEHLPYIVSVQSLKSAVFIEGGNSQKQAGGWRGEIEFTVVKQK